MQISTGYPNHGISIPIKPNSPPVLSSPHRNLVQSIGFVKPKSTHMFQSLNPTQYPNQIYQARNFSPKSLQLKSSSHPYHNYPFTSTNQSQVGKQPPIFKQPVVIGRSHSQVYNYAQPRQNYHLGEEMKHLSSHSASPLIQTRNNSPKGYPKKINIYFSQSNLESQIKQSNAFNSHPSHHLKLTNQPILNMPPMYQSSNMLPSSHQNIPTQEVKNIGNYPEYREKEEEKRQDYKKGETDRKLWEDKYYGIYSSFEFFVQKFDIICEEIYIIQEQFQIVSTEEEWNELRTRYTQLINKFILLREEIIYVVESNRQALNNQEDDDTPKEEVQKNLWQNRYYEILHQHQLLAQDYNKIKNELEPRRTSNQMNSEDYYREAQKISQLENALNSLHLQYKELQQSYNKLSQAYTHAINQIQQKQGQQGTPQDQIMFKLETDLKDAENRIQLMEKQLSKKMEGDNWDDGKQHSDELQMYAERIQQLQNDKSTLIQNVNEFHEELQKYHNQWVRNQEIINEQNQNLQNMAKQYQFLQQKLHQTQQLHNKIEEAIEIIKNKEQQQQQMKNIILVRDKQIQEITHHKNVFIMENQDLTMKIMNFQNQLQNQNSNIKKYQQKIRLLQLQLTKSTEQSSYAVERNEDNLTKNHQKNRKIKYLEEQLEDLKKQYERKINQKQMIIKEIKGYAEEQEEKLTKKLNEKQHLIKLLNDKIRSYENQLTNKNLQISRFRPQMTSSNSEEIKKLNDIIDKKNTEIQQFRKQKEKKNIQLLEQQQNYNTLQHQLHNKMIEIHNLKRDRDELHNHQAEIEALQNTIKKKNHQINELRLSNVEKQQLKFSIQSLERERIRLHQYLKEKTKQYENRENTIRKLQEKINTLQNEKQMNLSLKYSLSTEMENQQIKSKNQELKKLNYELQLTQITLSSHEKTIQQLQHKIQSREGTFSLHKRDLEKTINSYENQLKILQKDIKDLKNKNNNYQSVIEGQKVKINSLERSKVEGMSIFDKQIHIYKQKQTLIEQQNTQLNINMELCVSQLNRTKNQIQESQNKVFQLQEKILEKNQQIQEIKMKNSQQQFDKAHQYQDEITKLKNQLKISFMKVRNLEEQITNLQKKLKTIEGQSKRYKNKLYTQNHQYVSIRSMSQYSYLSKSKQTQTFQRKVAPSSKKQNQFLGISMSRITLPKPQHLFTQEVQKTDKNEETQQLLTYYKDKNKDIQLLNEQLLTANKLLKQKLSFFSKKNNQSASIEFYKTQIAAQKLEISHLQGRVKKLVEEK